MTKPTARLRALLKRKKILGMPSAYDPIGARIAKAAGFEGVYNGGFVTGGMTCISEPLVTMNEQIAAASSMARAVDIPVIADAGGGYGEPLHCMRTVREFIRGGVSGIHIEDQHYPKRAHYHAYVSRVIPRQDLVDKIKYACKERDQLDKDFVIIARSDAARSDGFKESITRVNMCADVGADMAMVFPRTPKEAEQAPRLCHLPLVHVQSRGNRDGRPLYTLKELEQMGYAMNIDAVLAISLFHHFYKQACVELKRTGDYTGMTSEQFTAARQSVEDLIGLEDFYEVESETVERGVSKKDRR